MTFLCFLFLDRGTFSPPPYCIGVKVDLKQRHEVRYLRHRDTLVDRVANIEHSVNGNTDVCCDDSLSDAYEDVQCC